MTEEAHRALRSGSAVHARQAAVQRPAAAVDDCARLLDALEQSQQIIHEHNDLNSLLEHLLDLLLNVFVCDRAWLVYPCDPDLGYWKIPLERCRPGCPGRDSSAGTDLPLLPEIAARFRTALATKGVVRYDSSASNQLPPEHAELYGGKAQLALALRPHTGKPWLLGLDQCSENRSWHVTEVRLFQQLGQRLEAALSSRLSLEELGNREKQLASLISNLPGAVYRNTIRHGATTLYISDRIKELCGYPAEDFLAGRRNLSDLCHPEDWQRIERILRRALHRLEPYSLEYRITDSSGEIRWVLDQGQAIYEEGGTAKCFDGVIFDISDRKQVNQELRQLRNLLRSTINAMPSALIGINSQARVSQWNREAEKLTGIPQQNALGYPLQEIFPELPLCWKRIEQTLRSRKVDKQTRISWEYRRQLRIVDIAIYPLSGRQVAGAVLRIDDVTARVNMEEVMIQHDKMLSIGGLAAGLAHEVNNPLSGIMQNLQVLRNRLNENLNKNRQMAIACGTRIEQINEYLKRRDLHLLIDASANSARRATDIIGNVLNFSRKDESDLHPCDLRQLLDASLELASSSYNQNHRNYLRKIAITREFAADLPLVPCQQSKIQQVFLNLLNNGAQAMLERLQRWEAAETETPQEQPRFILRLSSNGGRVRCEIADNGKGMDEETRRRIFEPFFTTKPAGQGTGLGMAICYFIICDQHRGHMSIESTPDLGTRVCIELPSLASPQ